MTMIDVSVIIPVYNTEKYIKRCVDSVINQKDVSIEIILIDDGSKDCSPKICDNYADKYSFITARHVSNSGPSTAKNIGYNLAKGCYVAFIDSDDEMRPNMLLSMYNMGKRHDADIVCCNYIQIDEKGKLSHTEHTGSKYVLSKEEALKAILIKDRIYSQCWTKIYKRATLDLHHIRNMEGLKTEEDFIFNIQAFACSNTVCVIDEPLYVYTHREKSLSKDYYRKNISQYIDNRLLRLELVDNLINERFPQLHEYSCYHCIFYYNELLGRISMFPKTFNDHRTHKVISYIKKHSEVLMKYHKEFGFSKSGAILIMYLPDFLYLYYRHWKGGNR